MCNDKENVYSFSRLDCFNQCQYDYYLTYVKGHRGDDNVYSYLGKRLHGILEDLQSNKIDKDTAIKSFMMDMDDIEILGYNFINQNIKYKYEIDIINYLENYERIDRDKYFMEREFKLQIDGIWIRGFIDLFYIDNDNKVVVLDYKTSSKFTSKELSCKVRQLILYAYAIEHLDGLEVKQVGFDMIKYVNKPWRNKMVLKERCEVSDFDGIDYKRGLVMIDYGEDALEDLKKYIKDTVTKIESLDKEDDRDWMPRINFHNNFSCKNLCNNYNRCKFQKKI